VQGRRGPLLRRVLPHAKAPLNGFARYPMHQRATNAFASAASKKADRERVIDDTAQAGRRRRRISRAAVGVELGHHVVDARHQEAAFSPICLSQPR
jgi:hypothetical protein